MDFEIVPYQQAGLIRLGMTRLEIRQLFPSLPEEMSYSFEENELPPGMANLEEIELQDLFDEAGVRVSYDLQPPHQCIAISFFKPANPIFRGQFLLRKKLRESQKWLQSIDESCRVEVDGVYSYKFGICLYSEDIEVLKNKPPVEVTVFTKGYYDDLE